MVVTYVAGGGVPASARCLAKPSYANVQNAIRAEHFDTLAVKFARFAVFLLARAEGIIPLSLPHRSSHQ
jgi:hypothetical protein